MWFRVFESLRILGLAKEGIPPFGMKSVLGNFGLE